MRRWKNRQCRSVQSIIGATQKRRDGVSGTFFVFSVTYASKTGPMSYHFRPILLHFDDCGTTASYFGGACRTMGTIIGRTRKDGSKAFTAQIVIKKGGAIVHREAETFDRKQAANAW